MAGAVGGGEGVLRKRPCKNHSSASSVAPKAAASSSAQFRGSCVATLILKETGILNKVLGARNL